jgi:hypothetical protein
MVKGKDKTKKKPDVPEDNSWGPMDEESEKLLARYLWEHATRKQQERIDELKKKLHVYIAHLWGHIMVFVAPTHGSVVDHILEMGYIQGVGPMDLGERVWELPAGGYKEDKVTLICSGDRQIEEDVKKQRQAEANAGAGI